MVLEHLFPDNWVEKKVKYSFILAFVYSTVSIIAARLLFGANSGIVSAMFTAILLLPYLRKLFAEEERLEKKEKKFSIKHLFRDNKHVFKAYFGFFFGVYLTYMMYSFLLPQFGINAFKVFKEQLLLDSAIRGNATFMTGVFVDIFLNNWWVLLACFMLALFTGDGAIFFITWNASSWGILFGYRALQAAAVGGLNPWWALFLIFAITLPHVFIEGAAYVFAAISGSIISDDIIEKSSEVRDFVTYIIFTIVFYVCGFYMVRAFFGWGTILGFVNVGVIVLLVHRLGGIFHDKKHAQVFKYNYWLFIIAILTFLIGALVETYVLTNSMVLADLYELAFMAA